MARGGRSKVGTYPPRKTFGTNLKLTNRGTTMGKISAVLPKEGGGNISRVSSTKVR